MTDEKPTTRAMNDFLRKIVRTGGKLTPKDWPAPLVLRRWLRRPEFITAINSLTAAIRFRADFQLTCVSADCADRLSRVNIPEEAEKPERQMTALSSVIRLAHGRERFHATEQARKERAQSSEKDDEDEQPSSFYAEVDTPEDRAEQIRFAKELLLSDEYHETGTRKEEYEAMQAQFIKDYGELESD